MNARSLTEEIESHKSDNQPSQLSKSYKKYLIFTLDQLQYGFPLSKIKEVIGYNKITEVPQVPSFFKGIINLRGRIISIVDLRVKLGQKAREWEPKKTCIIITETDDLTIGAIVDTVDEVMGVNENEICDKLELSTNIDRSFITGVTNTGDDSVVLFLSLEKLFSRDELKILSSKN